MSFLCTSLLDYDNQGNSFMKRILFITQNMERTGSEMVLWHLFNHIDFKKFKIHVFCIRRGALYDLLPSSIQKSSSYKESGLFGKKVLRTFLKTAGINPLHYQLNYIHRIFKPDYWYVNTLSIPWVYDVSVKLDVKIVTHIHELLYGFSFIKAQQFRNMIKSSNTILGCSEEVCSAIGALNHQDVRLQSSFIDPASILPTSSKINLIKQQFGIEKDDFVWAISGATTLMKGFDHMLHILDAFKGKPVKFLWIGRIIDDGLNEYIREIVAKNYSDQMFLCGPQAEYYYEHLACANGLLLLSREESFSLVLLEAAYLGLPTVSFDVGIAKSFINRKTGRVINNRDINSFIEAMKSVQNDHTIDDEEIKNAVHPYTTDYQIAKYQALLNDLN